MKGIGIIGGMIRGVILGEILLSLMSSSVLLPPVLYLVTPLLSFANYSLPLLICLPREEDLILESFGDLAPTSPTLAALPSKKSGSARTYRSYTANN